MTHYGGRPRAESRGLQIELDVIRGLGHADEVDREVVPKRRRRRTGCHELEIIAVRVGRVAVIHKRGSGVSPNQTVIAPGCAIASKANGTHPLLDLTG